MIKNFSKALVLAMTLSLGATAQITFSSPTTSPPAFTAPQFTAPNFINPVFQRPAQTTQSSYSVIQFTPPQQSQVPNVGQLQSAPVNFRLVQVTGTHSTAKKTHSFQPRPASQASTQAKAAQGRFNGGLSALGK